MAESLRLIKPCLEKIPLTSILLFHQLFCKLPYAYKTMNADSGHFILISNNCTMNKIHGKYVLVVIPIPTK